MELWEPCLVKYVRGIRIHEVLRDHVRFVFNRMEGKLEVIVLKEFGSVRMISKTPLLKFIRLQLGNWGKFWDKE
jgi:hypothetical protein